MVESKTQIEPSINTGKRQLEKSHWLSAGIVSVIALALYLFTLAPTVTLVDSGELILAARSTGVAHPPGFPLYVMLAHLFSLLPFGNVATRVHLASAIFAALAAGMMTLLVATLLSTPTFRNEKKKAKTERKKREAKKSALETEAEISEHPEAVFILAPAIIAGSLFAFSRTLWAYATIAEVYTINALLIVTIFWLMAAWRREALIAKANRKPVNDRKLYIAAFIFGLALGVHHVTVGLMLPALAIFAINTLSITLFSKEVLAFLVSKRVLYAALVSFAGLILVYTYLPLAASHSPLMNWGDPRTFERLWWHITGRQYQSFFDFSISRISEFVRLALRGFSAPFVPLALLFSIGGFAFLLRRNRTIFFFLSLIIAADVLYCLGYEIDEDKDAYYLPAFIALTVGVAYGVRWLLSLIQASGLRNVLTPIRTAIVLLLIPAIALASNFSFNNRSNYYLAHDYVENLLKTVEPHSLVLTTDWQVYSPFLYVREIEQTRRDAMVIDVNQLRRSWYYDYLNQAYPELIEKSRKEVNDLLEDLRHWDEDPEIYNKDVTLNQRINKRFYDMIMSFITNQIKEAPVYLTQDLAINRSSKDQQLTAALNQQYKITPAGLLFRVDEKSNTPDVADVRMQIRGLGDGTLHFDEDDVVMKKVQPVYLAMLTNTGIYLASQNKNDRAVEWFKQALAIDANYEPAKRALANSQAALQNPAAQSK